MKHTITLIPGDGIGPEVSNAVQTNPPGSRQSILHGKKSLSRAELERSRDRLYAVGRAGIDPQKRRRSERALGTAVAGGAPSLNVGLRQALDLYANLRPVKNLEGVQSRYQDVDLVIVRENTEDLYAGLEHTVVPGVVESLKIITEKASTRIARFAFEYARKHGRKKIHAIHKANIMKLSDGLFLTSIREVAAEYPDIEYKELIVDNACMQMVLNPQQFDMLLLTNLYGDIMSDLAAGLVGGLGVVPEREYGRKGGGLRSRAWHGARHRRKRNRESHGSADERIMMLDYLNEDDGGAKDRKRPAQGLSRGQVADAGCGRHSHHR